MYNLIKKGKILFIYDFLFGFLFLISGIKLLSSFLKNPLSSRSLLKKRGTSVFYNKTNRKKYRIFLEIKIFTMNGFVQSILSPMQPDLNHSDFMKLNKKELIPVYFNNGVYYYDSFRKSAKFGLIFIFISFVFFFLSIYSFFS